MKTVILCGGYGTRIRGVADNLPKPMIPVGEFPILWHIMKYYSSYGYKDFVLCLGYKAHVIKDFFLNYEMSTRDFTIKMDRKKSEIDFHSENTEADWNVTLANTGLNTMTGARVRKVEKYLGDDEHFMLTYGDGVGDVDIDALIKFHKSHGKVCTISGVRPPGRFGELVQGSNNLITGFNEKPQVTGGRINGGFFVCRREFFEYLSLDDGLVLEEEPMQKLVKDRQLVVFEHDGFWQPMDTAREYSLLNKLYKSDSAPWKNW